MSEHPNSIPPPIPAIPPQSSAGGQLYQQPLHYPPQQIPKGSNLGVRMLIPVGRSGWALAAGYLGLLSVTLVAGPLAIICGLLAIKDINKSKNTPHPRHGMGRSIFGIITGTLGTIGLAYTILRWR